MEINIPEAATTITLFPKRLRALREKRHKSRRVVSELCGLPTNAISKYERGETFPTVWALILIADYFDVSIDYLLGREKR